MKVSMREDERRGRGRGEGGERGRVRASELG
jgi:hypothetical protein